MLGRFLTRDLIELGGDPAVRLNSYSFGSSNPLVEEDPLGLQSRRIALGPIIGMIWDQFPATRQLQEGFDQFVVDSATGAYQLADATNVGGIVVDIANGDSLQPRVDVVAATARGMQVEGVIDFAIESYENVSSGNLTKIGYTGAALGATLLPFRGAGKPLPRPVVLGENMAGRVKPYALRHGYRYYDPWSWKRLMRRKGCEGITTEDALRRNAQWLRRQIQRGAEVVDIGIDPRRNWRSEFYQMEVRLARDMGARRRAVFEAPQSSNGWNHGVPGLDYSFNPGSGGGG